MSESRPIMERLRELSLLDQFGNPVTWEKFEGVPWVLVMAGELSAPSALKWGKALRNQFNPDYEPKPDHLQLLHPSENLKVIPVVCLPDAPGWARRLFFEGFRRLAGQYGLVLDFGARIALALMLDSVTSMSHSQIIVFGRDGRMVGVLQGQAETEEDWQRVLKWVESES